MIHLLWDIGILVLYGWAFSLGQKDWALAISLIIVASFALGVQIAGLFP
jgi:hypothetical protein